MNKPTNRDFISHEVLEAKLATIDQRIAGLDRVTDAKFVTLETLMNSQAEKVALALNAADKAVTKAEIAAEKRFEGVNEFRATLSDQAMLLMPRTEVVALVDNINTRHDEAIKNLASQISDLKEYRAGTTATEIKGRQNVIYLFSTIAAMTGLVGIAIAILANASH